MTSEADGPAIAIEVRREEPATTREVPLQARELEPGEALLRVDSFALTANNVTYAALGETMGYWRFFPASEEGWGRVPVWGFADVVASRAEGLDAGERSYGYFPMATHLRVQADARGGRCSTASLRTAPSCRRSTTATCAPPQTPATTRRSRTCRC